jgi:tRNA pseudouridine55 synthase
MDGFLLVDKPTGISSFGVVSKVRWTIKDATGQKIKIGHTGTLDPMASGLMILVLGSYTKLAGQFSKLDKVYEAELELGAISSTGDKEGEITPKSDRKPSRQQIDEAIKPFIGDIMQIPPIHSAIKVGGRRAYKLARAGKEVKLEARPVRIFSIDEINYEYPKLSFRTHVGSGTYIRSLASDIGEGLGTGAYLSKLRRTAVAGYSVEDAVTIDNLSISGIIDNVKQITPN